MKANFYQCRNFKWIYLFTAKDSGIMSLEIFDIFQKRVFKHNFSATTQSFLYHIQKGNISISSLTNNLPEKYRTPERYKICVYSIALQSFYKKLLQCIEEHSMQNSAIPNIGASFKNSGVTQKITKKTNYSPNCAIIPFKGNNLAKLVIRYLRARNYRYSIQRINIEKFTRPKKHRKTNRSFIENAKQKAFSYERQKKYATALEYYKTVFLHTNDWHYYSKVPILLRMMNQHSKKSLAYLHLAKYQLDTGAVKEAIATLKHYKHIRPSPAIDLILNDLYLFMNKARQVTDLLAKLTVETLEGTLVPYNDILERSHLQLSYVELAKLVTSPEEKAHILCKGALEACFAKQYTKAKNLMQQARDLVKNSVLNELVFLKICEVLGEKTQPKLLDLARTLYRGRQWQAMLKAYKMLITVSGKCDRKNRYRAYIALGKREKASRYVLQCAKDLCEKQWRFSSFGLTPEDSIMLARNMPQTVELLNFENRYFQIEEITAIALHLPKTLLSLNLRGCKLGISEISILAQHLPDSLQELYLWDNRIDSDGAMVLAQNLPPTLKKLDLHINRIGYLGVKTLAQYLPADLEELNLRANNIKDEAIKAFACNLPATNRLRLLNISENSIEYGGIKILAQHLPGMLTTLTLYYNRIGNHGVKELAQYLPNMLQELYLDHNEIGIEGAVVLAKYLPKNLRLLNLNDNKIRTTGIKAIAQNLPPMLQDLRLNGNEIGDAGIKELAQKLPKTLTALYLSSNEIGDTGASILALHLPLRLRILHLCLNQIGDIGAKMLALHLPKTLTSLHLSNNNIRDAGIKELSPALPLMIRSLGLHSNQIGNAGAKELTKLPLMPKLQLFDLRSNHLESSIKHLLKKKFQHVRNARFECSFPFVLQNR